MTRGSYILTFYYYSFQEIKAKNRLSQVLLAIGWEISFRGWVDTDDDDNDVL